MVRPRVAFVTSGDASFIQTDLEILRAAFPVRLSVWRGKRSIPSLTAAIARSDVAFSWFALDHAYGACRLARLFRKKTVVVVGGIDAANRPDIGYGVFLNPRMAARTRYAVAHSDRVLTVSDATREDLVRNTGLRRGDIATVPLGFDTNHFRPDGGPKTTVLTVGVVNDTNLLRKGLLAFARTARELPDLPFVVVGGGDQIATKRLQSEAPANLRVLGRLSDDQLLEQFRRARVYAQLSEYEAFGSALAEAMACSCVPVGTEVGGIPGVIGNVGFYAPVGDWKATTEAIRRAYESGDGDAARRRIQESFSLEKRRSAICEIVKELAP